MTAIGDKTRARNGVKERLRWDLAAHYGAEGREGFIHMEIYT